MAISIEEMAVVKNVGEQEILGNLFWTSVGKQLVHVDDLKRKLIQSGLGEEWLPNQIRVVDAFRRATREVQTKKETNQAKVFKNYLVREVYSNTEFIQRNIVVETVDQNNKRLGYKSESGIIKLDKKNRSISFETADSTIRELCLEAEQKFLLYRDHYSSQHMRVMVSKILSSLAPTPMRPNGVIYFIPSAQTERLMKLVTLVRSLENSEAFQVPVIDTSDNRFMVNKKLEDHLENLLTQCKTSDGMRKGDIRALVNEANNAISDYKNYKEIVVKEKENFEKKIMRLRAEVMKIVQK